MKKINLTQNKYALVDDIDFILINKHTWCVINYGKNWYANTQIRINKDFRYSVTMHRLILGLQHKDGKQVDHINGNGLDNRRENLRLCTTQQNNRNSRSRKNTTSKYKGVSKHRDKWLTQINIGNGSIPLGVFKSEIQAARLYDRVALAEFGEFAYLNFDKSDYKYYITIEEALTMRRKRKSKNESSKYIGVHWNKAMKKWRTRAKHNNIITELGHYSNEIEAAKIYDKFVIDNNLNRPLNFS